MKLFTLALLFVVTTASAQWSNTNNLFADSLHMPVCTATQTQTYPLLIRSYPDSGYIFIWIDARTSPAAIFAQKYNKTGNSLWAANGVQVTSPTNTQRYEYQGQNYRSHSYAATDGAGGFYITYADNGTTERVGLQHVKSDGTVVFSGPGNIIATAPGAGYDVGPQLIADGNGGCYLAFSLSSSDIHMYDYKDVNGTLQNLGGGIMNENAVQVTSTSPCGNYTDLNYPDATVWDYNIFPDLQGNCNIVMYLSVNGSGSMLAYNKLWRAKQNATANLYYRDIDFSVKPTTITYQQGNAYRLYYLVTDHQEISCGSNPNVYTVNQYRLIQNGFLVLDGGPTLYDIKSVKGVTVATPGNINVSLLEAVEKRYSSTTGASDPFVKMNSVKEEIYDSIPYQRASFTSPDYPGYNQAEPPGLDKLGNFADTALAGPTGGTYYEATLAGGGNQVFSAALIPESSLSKGFRNLRLQHLAVESTGPDSLSVVYKTTAKQGVLIGQDQTDYTEGYGGQWDLPMFAVNNTGNALFYIKEQIGSDGYGPIHVSPIFNGAQLAWGVMGKTIGTAFWNGNGYGMFLPNVVMDPFNGTAAVCWLDYRNTGTSGYDIYMRHLDNLNDPAYQPPYKPIRALPNPYTAAKATQVMYGTSNTFTTFEASSIYGSDPGVSPVADISDNYNLGNVTVSTYDNTTGIRNFNGAPYLDRSWTITPDNNPNGAATITIRLLFTTAEFDALAAADPSIKTPGDLAVIKQPSGSGSTYSVVANEKTIIPTSWGTINGGYYLEIQITSFSNFFIFKSTIPLPLNWLDVQAKWQNNAQASVSWAVADQKDVQSYTVQRSADGIIYADACTVTADPAQTTYSCIVPGDKGKNYYRVAELDNDGNKNYSRTVLLEGSAQGLSVYPNPAKDVLYVAGLDNYTSMQIVNASGNIVRRQMITSQQELVNISALAPGVYLLTVTGGSDTKTVRFIKY